MQSNVDGEVERLTEAEVLDLYWEYWHRAMLEKFPVTSPEISVENCIEDFMVVNWAWYEEHDE